MPISLPQHRAVFFDRDGTINPDPGYINDPADFDLYPGVPQALRQLRQAGFLLVLVTNQSGIGRGLVQPQNLCRIHEKLQSLLRPFQAEFDRIYICPHHPDDACTCRKPLPGLALQAFAELNITPQGSYLLGDKKSDMEMAINAGLQPIAIGDKPHPGLLDIPRFPTVKQALPLIIGSGKGFA